MPLVVVNNLAIWKLRLIQANRCPVMAKLQHQAINRVQPDKAEYNVCTLMLMTNLAEPQWISVSCSLPLLSIVMCLIDKANMTKGMQIKVNQNAENTKNTYFCANHHIMINTTCYHFLRNNITLQCDNFCNGMISAYFQSISIFHHLYTCVLLQNAFPLVVNEMGSDEGSVFRFYNNFGHLKYKPENASKFSKEFHTFKVKKTKILIGINMFHCLEGGYISVKSICDGNIDCPNSNSDEELCICNANVIVDHGAKKHLCEQILQGESKNKCTILYQMNEKGVCKKYMDF